MSLLKPLVLTKVVEHDLCIGCGACISVCPSKALDITWNNYGFLVAQANENRCDNDGACLNVCPFNTEPNESYQNEDGLAIQYLSGVPLYHPKIGHYNSLYAGYSHKHRESSSSGGIGTYIYEKLFDLGIIKHVVTVGDSNKPDAHYQYKVVSSKEELLTISKTRYHPVTLATVLTEIKELDGDVAISGVGCFIKAIRLAQNNDPSLKEKIKFLVGIICGGVKSTFFTEYLADKAGATSNQFSNPEYRVKDPESTASDYGFSCIDNPTKIRKIIKMRQVGDMWGSGLFKANACDFCDDVTTELADISLGDAWLSPYDQDGRGHNVAVSRSNIADQILQQGLISGELELEELSQESFLASQQGSFNHRHDGINTRIEMVKRIGMATPPTRVMPTPLPFYLQLVQKARRCTRAKSLQIWALHKNSIVFDKNMKLEKLKLKVITKLSHVIRRAKSSIGIKS
ncbi:Coenzyme F420 hydrogenase/dehydrogenase, beta subunit C-terminal domain [Alcaligenes endophyticus]|uniref:Coenzyme F420 hydrogenase/dehydrogenase, beta subunit C-terminal domain n=1 Tax=Alcaligenes endophyticus TaxID=1929088 RepID=A0ABT8EFU2_9BURK|nr:Coenzyme F420 hydrogenase/dehydrogenase, beta subunit C-terminal domain [Alcaligenes endophyticus]MCX5590207.1 Coenzyme F420 hydrogenase/dehydrogenase, beta subunit C-terminal domain [Alcaligenes endophyticus]MDN4120130.1 Coenzyme F420 hydrogenase/dehydrogenase, beta subunit C-terminal domain [Alcaligenes endophyticus]